MSSVTKKGGASRSCCHEEPQIYLGFELVYLGQYLFGPRYKCFLPRFMLWLASLVSPQIIDPIKLYTLRTIINENT